MTVVADAGPVIALAKLDQLALLPRLYGEVAIPPAVRDEVLMPAREPRHPDAEVIEGAITDGQIVVIESGQDLKATWPERAALGLGEQQSIELAQRLNAAWLLIDDARARATALALGLHVKGTLGVVIDAQRAGLLTVQQRDDLFPLMADRPDIWIAEGLLRRVWSGLLMGEQ